MISRIRNIEVMLGFALTILLLGSQARAENWVEVPCDEDGIDLYYNSDSIQKIGGLVRMKVKLEMPLIDLTKLTVFDFDCSKGRFQEYLVADDGAISKVNDIRSVSELAEAEKFSHIACKTK